MRQISYALLKSAMNKASYVKFNLENCKKTLASIIFLGLIFLYGDRYLRVCIYLLREIVSCQVDWSVNGDCVWLGISPLA